MLNHLPKEILKLIFDFQYSDFHNNLAVACFIELFCNFRITCKYIHQVSYSTQFWLTMNKCPLKKIKNLKLVWDPDYIFRLGEHWNTFKANLPGLVLRNNLLYSISKHIEQDKYITDHIKDEQEENKSELLWYIHYQVSKNPALFFSETLIVDKLTQNLKNYIQRNLQKVKYNEYVECKKLDNWYTNIELQVSGIRKFQIIENDSILQKGFIIVCSTRYRIVIFLNEY